MPSHKTPRESHTLPSAVAAAAAIAMAFSSAVHGDCQPAWVPIFAGDNGTDGIVYDLAVFDDGNGPALYVAGNFTNAGGQMVNNIARWDGSEWSSLGWGTDNIANALAVFDDGTGPALYVGGWFQTANGVLVNRIAKWDGTDWSPVGSGMNQRVATLTVFDDGNGPALYAGGYFTSAGGVSAARIAKWDGEEWSPLSSGMSGGANNGAVFALTAFDDGNGPALYAAGEFTHAGGTTVNRIARWDGAAWSSLGSGLAGGPFWGASAFTLGVYDAGSGPNLFVGGDFTTAGGASASRIARWNGSSWSGVGGANNPVRALHVYDDGAPESDGPALFVGGDFIQAGGVSANRIVRWDGDEWSPLVTGMTGPSTPRVFAFAEFDDGQGDAPALFVGGNFTAAGGLPANFIAKWQGCAAPACADADLNCDGVVDVSDLLILLGAWGECPDPAPGSCPADLNGDGVVDVSDLLILLGAWGPA